MNIITQDLISSHISTFSNKCKTRELACYYLLWLSCNDFPILQVSPKQSKNSCKKKMQLFLVSFSKYLQKPISLTFSSVHTVSALDCTHQSNSRVSKIIKCPASAQPSSTYLYKHIAYCFFFFKSLPIKLYKISYVPTALLLSIQKIATMVYFGNLENMVIFSR